MKQSKRRYLTYLNLVCSLFFMYSCVSGEEDFQGEPDTTELVRQWQENLESLPDTTLGSWIILSPNANIDSLMTVWYTDSVIVRE